MNKNYKVYTQYGYFTTQKINDSFSYATLVIFLKNLFGKIS